MGGLGDPAHTGGARCHLGDRVKAGTPVMTSLRREWSLLEKQEIEMSELNDVSLSDLELDVVSGGLKIQLGGLGFDIGEKGIMLGIYLNGVGGVAIFGSGSACGVLKGVGGGCI
jgi:hypothetical protein